MTLKKLLAASALCGLAAAWSGGASAAPATFQLSDLKRLIGLSDPQISPDGKHVAVIVSTPNWKTDKADQEIDLIDVATGARRTLTWKRTGLSSPRWSPDGGRLAFVAVANEPKADAKDDDAKDDAAKEDAGSDGKQAQIFVMPMDGGDAVRVTDAKHGVSSFSWSPDGKSIAYIAADDPANAKAIKAHDDAFQVTDNNFLVRAALAPSHLWVAPSTGGEAKRLTQGPWSLETDQSGAPEPSWTADGATIAFSRFPDPYWARSFKSEIDRAPAAGGAVETLARDQGASEFRYAPVGTASAFARARGGDQNNGTAVYVTDGGRTTDVTAGLARDITSYAWMPDGKALLLLGAEGTHSAMWRQPIDGPAQRLDLDGVEVRGRPSVSKTGAVALIASTPGHPAELYVIDAVGGKPRRLTDVNAFAETLTLGRVSTVDWQGPNGFHEDGVLTYPPDFRPGVRYPLVLEIHGGPEAASTEAFSPLTQLLAAAGFIVFEPNYRGSTNLGDAYQHAIFRDTGEGPGKDVMAGLAAVKKLGVVDPARIGVSGWSYGGYMTTWLSSHYDVWKAAVSGAALTDWVLDYTVAYYQEGDLYFFGGTPWTAQYRDIWRAQSPITYAQNVKAPTLIMGDVGDPNVPLINSYEWYHALRDNGVDVQFFAYPADTHFPSDLVRTTDVYRRWVEWMREHLNATAQAPAKPAP